MTVTEFAGLEAQGQHAVDSPIIQEFLTKVAQRQAAWSGYPLLFFQDTSNSKVLYLISGWRDVPAHGEWIASTGNQELLREMEGIMTVREFRHLDIDFETLPQDVAVMTLDVLPHGPSDTELSRAIADVGHNSSGLLWQCTGRTLEEPEGELHYLKAYSRFNEACGRCVESTVVVGPEGSKEAAGERSIVMHRLAIP